MSTGFFSWENEYARLRDELAANLQERVRLQATINKYESGDKVSRHYACPDCAALRAKLRAMTKERDSYKAMVKEQWAQPELAAAQATNAKLREALKRAGEAVAYESHDDSVGYYVCCQVATYRPHAKGCYIQEALAIPTDDALVQQRDELAAACQWYSDNPDSPISALEHIRAALAKVKP